VNTMTGSGKVRSNMAGLFITVEGTEGVGKSSSLEHIQARLEANGLTVVRTREPGGTELGERVREVILSSEVGSLSANTEALLMFAARAHHLDEIIRPALAAGSTVLCDRFSDATVAYQGGGRGAAPEFLASLRSHVHPDVEPDLTILLDAPVEVGLQRIENREHDHFEQEDRDFFERVRQAYLEIAEAELARVRVIDASAELHKVRDSIDRVLNEFLASRER
jgi:dTMP kinase